MDATFCVGTDLEMSRMFDQYLFKGTDPSGFDLSLTIPESVQDNTNSYMNTDQTFHTPSFGDEEFEIPPLSIPLHHGQGPDNGGMQEQSSTNTLNMSDMLSDNRNLMVGQPLRHPPQVGGNNGGQSHGSLPQFPPQNFELPSISVSNSVMEESAHHPNNGMVSLSSGSQGHQIMMMNPPVTMMTTQPTQPLTTISQSQLSSQLGLHMASNQPSDFTLHGSPASNASNASNNTSPGLETSEDSDDNTPLAQLGGAVKRPLIPEETKPLNTTNKKTKTIKKRKKRDPNEPQKPVSAYALFFRDTQAAIKGQNPNASFGEVSKIVASMWDSLDADHKNVYKKKTEAAKKEYLKALAAYRASLVSKQPALMETYSPPMQPIRKKSIPENNANQLMNTMGGMNRPSPPMMSQQQLSPQQQQQQSCIPMNTQPSQQQQLNAQISYTQNMLQKSNHHFLMFQNSPPFMTKPEAHHLFMERRANCMRNGCNNQAIESPDWDNEYCSNECVINHCRDVFTAWVAARSTSNVYASVK